MAITSKKRNGINPGVTFYKIDLTLAVVWITNLTVQTFPDFLGLERHINLSNPFSARASITAWTIAGGPATAPISPGSLGPKGVGQTRGFFEETS